MASIKVDRNQTSAVVALLAVLAVVCGVIVFRMRATPAVQAAAQETQSASSGAMQPIAQDLIPGSTARNPFKKPEAILSAYHDPPKAVPGDPAAGVPTGVPPMPVNGGPFVTTPTSTVAIPGSEQTSTTVSTAQGQSAPEFTLMATIISSGKSCAVLRMPDSQVKVVRVGDMVDGRFRLKSLKPNCAELTDGVVTVTAKRGQTQYAEPTGQ